MYNIYIMSNIFEHFFVIFYVTRDLYRGCDLPQDR